MSLPLLPLLLASTSSLLPQPLWAATEEASFLDMGNFSFLLMLVVASAMTMLIAALIHHLGGRSPRTHDKPNAPVEPMVEVEPDELVRFMRSTLEQLSSVSAELRSTTRVRAGTVTNAPDAIQQSPDQTVSTMAGLRLTTGQGDKAGRDVATAPQGITAPLDAGNETDSPSNLLALGSTSEMTRSGIRDVSLAQLDAKMRKLTELITRLHEERQALGPSTTLETSGSTTANRHYLSFTLGDEQFAVSTLSIHGVVEAVQLVAEPSMPPKIRKAIRLRGTLVPVIDLGARIAGQPIEIGWSTRIIILEVASGDSLHMIGVLVDTVGKVLEIAPTAIEPPPVSSSEVRHDLRLGTAKTDNRTVTLLDIGRLLSANGRPLLNSAIRTHEQRETLQ